MSNEHEVALATKKQIAEQLKRALKRKKLSQSSLARQMRTSRAVVHRILSQEDRAITLSTLAKALAVLDLKAKITLRAA